MTDGPFESQTESLAETLAEDEPPNVAVVSEPYAGRERVIEEATERLDEETETVAFSSVADGAERAGTLGNSNFVIVGGCEYLYTRRIDGFEPLDRFVEAVASSEKTVVASWNSYGWSYAEHATDVDDLFQEVVRLPSVGARTIADYLSSECDVSEFKSDLESLREDNYSGLVERLASERFDRLPIDMSRFASEESENVFERLTALSGGNPGVACALFENRAWNQEHDEIDLSYEDAFALRVVLSKENVDRGVLEEVVAPRSTQKTLRRLSDAGVVERDDERVSLRPERLADTFDYLKRRRLVW